MPPRRRPRIDEHRSRHLGPRPRLLVVAAGFFVVTIVVASPVRIAAQPPPEGAGGMPPDTFLAMATDPETRSPRRTAPFLDWLAGRQSAQIALLIDAADASGLTAMADCIYDEKEKTCPLRSQIRRLLGGRSDDPSIHVEIAVILYGGKDGLTYLASTRHADASTLWAFTDTDSALAALAAAIRRTATTGSCRIVDEPSDESPDSSDWFDFDAVQKTNAGANKEASVEDAIRTSLDGLKWSEQTACGRGLIVVGRNPPQRNGDAESLTVLAISRDVHVVGLLTAPSVADTKTPVVEERESMRRFLQPLCGRTGGRLIDLQGKPARYWSRDSWSVGEGKEFEPITSDDLADIVVPRAKDLPGVMVYYSNESSWPEDQVEGDIILHLLEGVFLPVEPSLRTYSDKTAVSLAQEKKARWCIGIHRRSFFDQRFIRLRLASSKTTVTAAQSVWQRSFTLNCRNRVGVFEQVHHNLEQLLMDADPQLEEAVRTVRNCDLRLSFEEDVASDSRAQKAILSAIRSLEESILSSEDNADPSEALGRAESQLATSFRYEPANPFAHLLMAHCHFNRLQLNPSSEQPMAFKYAASLQAARDYARPRSPDDCLRLEIEAEYRLMIERDYAEAIKMYETLADETEHPANALNAHWMLAGLYLGDWGIAYWAPELVDPKKAREHVIEILARWPGSPQAKYYDKCRQDECSTAQTIPLHGRQLTNWLGTR